MGAMSCKDNLNQSIWAYITHVKPRRYLVVDVERGLVSGMFMFRHAGTETSYVNEKGETVPFSAAMLKKQAVVISEVVQDRGRQDPAHRGRDDRQPRPGCAIGLG